MAFNRKRFESLVSPHPGGSRASYEARVARRRDIITESQSLPWREVNARGMEKAITGKLSADITPGEQATITKAVQDTVGDYTISVEPLRHGQDLLNFGLFMVVLDLVDNNDPQNLYIVISYTGFIDIYKCEDDWWYIRTTIAQTDAERAFPRIRPVHYFVCDQLPGLVTLIKHLLTKL